MPRASARPASALRRGSPSIAREIRRHQRVPSDVGVERYRDVVMTVHWRRGDASPAPPAAASARSTHALLVSRPPGVRNRSAPVHHGWPWRCPRCSTALPVPGGQCGPAPLAQTRVTTTSMAIAARSPDRGPGTHPRPTRAGHLAAGGNAPGPLRPGAPGPRLMTASLRSDRSPASRRRTSVDISSSARNAGCALAACTGLSLVVRCSSHSALPSAVEWASLTLAGQVCPDRQEAMLEEPHRMSVCRCRGIAMFEAAFPAALVPGVDRHESNTDTSRNVGHVRGRERGLIDTRRPRVRCGDRRRCAQPAQSRRRHVGDLRRTEDGRRCDVLVMSRHRGGRGWDRQRRHRRR